MTTEKIWTSLSQDIEACIDSEWYINAGASINADDFQPPVPSVHPLHKMTICFLVLKSGRVVQGSSLNANQDDRNPDLFRALARKNAERSIWPAIDIELPAALVL